MSGARRKGPIWSKKDIYVSQRIGALPAVRKSDTSQRSSGGRRSDAANEAAASQTDTGYYGNAEATGHAAESVAVPGNASSQGQASQEQNGQAASEATADSGGTTLVPPLPNSVALSQANVWDRPLPNTVDRVIAELREGILLEDTSSSNTLLVAKRNGDLCVHLKEKMCKHGEFEMTFRQHFDEGHEWRAKRMRLSREFPNFLAAKAYFEAQGRVFASDDYSMQRVFDLIKEHAAVLRGDPIPEKPARLRPTMKEFNELRAKAAEADELRRRNSEVESKYEHIRGQLFEVEGEAERLRAELDQARQRIAELERRLAP